MESGNAFGLLQERITRIAIGAFYDVYNVLSGFPEYVLCRALVVALTEAGLSVEQEVQLSVWFRGRELTRFRADIVVEGSVIVEVKTAPDIQPFHKRQLLNYLHATDLEVGLLLNFGNRPTFARMVYENARKQYRREVPPDQACDVPQTPP